MSEWWRDAVVYQVYPRSFADANHDGIGDLKGITQKLDYLKTLGVDAVWLSPFYRSPQNDAGYDVADYRRVDALFGSLEDCDGLLTRAHDLGLRVIVDLVPNHTSEDHEWFRQALASPAGSRARQRYIFRDGRGRSGHKPPNNWQSIFGGPAWTQVSDGQWYLHLFDSSQPDLNWEDPQVREEFLDILTFWVDRGVDGFRVDVAHGLVKAEGLPDWDGTGRRQGSSDTARSLPDGPTQDMPLPMFDQDGVHEVYRQWRKHLDGLNPEVALVAEAWVEPLSRLALYVRRDEMQQAFNFAYLTAGWDADNVKRVIDQTIEQMGYVGAPATWVLSNHDVIRHASRFGLDVQGRGPNGVFANDPQPDGVRGLRRAKAATLQMLGLPGSSYIYQGEELGLPEHTTLPDEVRQDPSYFRTNGNQAGRDGCRIPMPWDNAQPHAGFSFGADVTPWLPQPAGYADLAVNAQVGVEDSVYEFYRTALSLRRRYQLGRGTLRWWGTIMAANPQVLAFENNNVVVLTNYSADDQRISVEGSVIHASAGVRQDEGGIVLPGESSVWVELADL